MGDMNTKIRGCNTGYEEVMGTNGLGDMNNNGERFPDLCAEDELVIGWSAFPQKKKIHNATWVSSNPVVGIRLSRETVERCAMSQFAVELQRVLWLYIGQFCCRWESRLALRAGNLLSGLLSSHWCSLNSSALARSSGHMPSRYGPSPFPAVFSHYLPTCRIDLQTSL